MECVKDYCRFEINNLKKPKIPDINGKTISLVGSGKDDVKTINISTLSSIVLATFKKCYVIKHGSFAGSSTFGNRDILESFGINTSRLKNLKLKVLKDTFLSFLPIEEYIRDFDKKYGGNFIFFHPLSYCLAGVLNPYYLDYLVMGITDIYNVKLSGRLLQYYNYKGVIVSGEIKGYGQIDELSPFGISKVYYFDKNFGKETTILPQNIFQKKLKPSKYIFQSKSLKEEKRKFEEVLKGTAPFEAKAFVAMNAGIGLSLITKTSLRDSIKEILEVINSGEPYEVWEKYKQSLYED